MHVLGMRTIENVTSFMERKFTSARVLGVRELKKKILELVLKNLSAIFVAWYRELRGTDDADLYNQNISQ